MDDKLKTLLDKINMDSEYYSLFDDGKFLKLYINKEHKVWNFFIHLKNILPINVLKHFEDGLVKSFVNVKDVYATFEYDSFEHEMIIEYFKYILEKINLIKMFANHKIDVEEDTLIINVLNKVEFRKLDKERERINTFLKRYGFNLDFKIVINDKERNLVKEEIEKDIVIKVEPSKEFNPLIIGNEIKARRIIDLRDIIEEESSVVVEAYVFAIDLKEFPNKDFKIATFKISDTTDSLNAKFFTRSEDDFKTISSRVKVGNWYRIRGGIKNDTYIHDLSLNIRDMMEIPSKTVIRMDEEPEKRVELHAHTHMSQMDGVVNVLDLAKRASKWGHKAIAITDHNCCQAYPDAYNKVKGINIIYGVEMNMIDDNIDIVIRESDLSLADATYVVFDFETTGFNATSGDSIIEIGAVKLHKGKIIDTFQTLINPGREISDTITKITNITNDMLVGKEDEKTAIKRFIEWYGDLPMVAHNAKFDISFLESAFNKYHLGKFNNTVIDTLELSKALDPNLARHSLSALVKRYEIPFDESGHHRADYDAKATALLLDKMLNKMTARNIEKISDIKKLVSKDDIHKLGRPHHITLLAKNQVGLKNLFRLISLSNTKYIYKTSRILRSEIIKNREGILIGSSCADGEIFTLARSKTDEEMNTLMSFYDYIEVQPLSVYNHLLQLHDFDSEEELKAHIEKVIRIAKDNKKIVVATGDVHHLDPEDKIYREIIINQNIPGGGRHPLNREAIKNIPSQHFMTTREMLDEFAFLGEEVAYEIVVTNSNVIADMIEPIVVIRHSPKPLSPKMENSDQIVRDLTYGKAHSLYGDELPQIIEERLEKELSGIIGGGFDVIYLIAQKLVKKSNDDGYLVGSRGSVGSSLVATFCNITEVNPLPPHYVCPNCKKSIFDDNDKPLSDIYGSGFDLPDKICECGTMFLKQGQNIPFSSFLGFNADKVPDIDLNFSGEYQAVAHDYTKELFGEHYVFRAGTIGTVAAKTAYGFVKGYFEDKGKSMPRSVEIERLSLGCTGVKRTTGQHPGGIVVIPNYMDVLDFTPYQYPADDPTSKWYTTHFDYHPMEDDLLKLDILGHDDPTILRMLQNLSGKDILSIPLDDKDVLSIFSSPDVLGVTKEQIMCEVGTIGVPEFGTNFVMKMAEEIKPKTFEEIVKVCGLAHGTGIWAGNGKELLVSEKAKFNEIVGYREELISMLIKYGMDKVMAFKITEYIRKSYRSQKAKMKDERWVPLHNELLKFKDVLPDWFIDHCETIEYLFPKAHAVAYVMMACRVAWFKVHQPIYYYAAYLSIRCHDFDIEAMIKGYDAIKEKIIEINNKGFDKTNKEEAILDVLYTALELTARGFKISHIDLYKSDATNFIIDEDNKTLIPPFRTIDGLGDIVAKKIINERTKGNFISIEDFAKRARVSQTIIDKMRIMGILDDMPETNQLTLF